MVLSLLFEANLLSQSFLFRLNCMHIFCCFQIGYMVFLALFSYVILVRQDKTPSISETVLIIFVFTLCTEEIRQVTDGKLNRITHIVSNACILYYHYHYHYRNHFVIVIIAIFIIIFYFYYYYGRLHCKSIVRQLNYLSIKNYKG